jgi:hypothetical protein
VVDVLSAADLFSKDLDMNEQELSRRRFVKRAALSLPVLTTFSLLWSGPACAGTASKSEFHYQDHPSNGKRCGGCAAFTPPLSGGTNGACSIVAGVISPDGWCMAFTPK